MTYLLAGALGGLLAFFFAVPAIITEIIHQGKEKDLPLLVDVKTLWGHKVSQKSVFFLGLLLHLILGFGFGFLYPVFVTQGWKGFFSHLYTFLSLLVYIVVFWLVIQVGLFPLLGFGFFGKKEGAFVWLETLISLLLIGLGLWVLIQYYRPVFFV